MLNLVFELKFLDVLMGREDPIEFDIYLALYYCLFFVLSWVECFVGVMGGMFLTPLCFCIFIYICLIHLF